MATMFSWVMGISLPHKRDYRRIADTIDGQDKLTILNAGCGSGTLEAEVSSRLPRCKIVALDFSSRMLFWAKRRCRKFTNISFVQADLNDVLPFVDSSCDVITCFQVVFALRNRLALLREFKRVLRQSGAVFIVDPKPNFSILRVVRSHFREAAHLGWLRSLAMIATTLIRIPVVVTLLPFEVVMSAWDRRGYFHQAEIAEWRFLVKQANLEVVSITDSVAGQCWLIQCKRMDV